MALAKTKFDELGRHIFDCPTTTAQKSVAPRLTAKALLASHNLRSDRASLETNSRCDRR